VSPRPCVSLAELRSAYVDNALGDEDREKLLAHLAVCGACRSDVEELRRVRELLSGSRADPGAPAELSSRLVSIAGRRAGDPLWTRPFRQASSGVLPSMRRARRLRLGSASVALVGLVTMTAGLGYAAAPSVPLAAVSDPTVPAQAEFSSMLSQSKLTSQSVSAVMLVPPENLSPALGAQSPSADPDGRRRTRLSGIEARAVLERASFAAGQFSYAGTQTFTATLGGHRITATVDIDTREGQGSQLSIYNDRGEKVMSGFVPPAATSRMVDTRLLHLLERNYNLTGWRGSEVANRRATVLEAAAGGRVAARWWIDDESGLLVGQESYDRNGRLIWSSRFTTLRVGGSESILDHLPPRLGAQTTTTTLTVSSATELAASGWSCPESLAGLALLRVRSDQPDNPQVLHMIYSDGLSTVSVFEQRGQLAGSPKGSQWDAALGAFLRQDTSGKATWQSGVIVYTVVTDGSADLLRDAVRNLPHEPPMSRTTMERIQAGWAEILARAVRRG
jgi:Putative zinc-finger